MSFVTPESPRAQGRSSDADLRLPQQTIPQELAQALDLSDDEEQDLDEDMPGAEDQQMDSETPLYDFDDHTRPPMSPVNPFGANEAMGASTPSSFTISEAIKPGLNDAQQQRLINYLDNQLMSIQRLYVKHISGNKDAPSWSHMVHLLDNLLEFIWFGITGVSGGIKGIYHKNVFDYPMETPSVKLPSTNLELVLPSNLKNNGCISYLITIMGELITFVEKFPLESYSNWLETLRLFAKIDDTLCISIDYGQTLVTTTEKVRINSLVQRTKILIVGIFDEFGLNIQRGFDSDQDLKDERDKLAQFQSFVGELYEGLIDRTSI